MTSFKAYVFSISVILLFSFDAENNHKENLKLSLKETLVIESGDGTNEKPIIGFADHVTADRKGNIYVYDGRDGRNIIYKYDKEGNFLGNIGREGRGPGEHLQITALFVDSNGRLITADRKNARITVFNSSGKEIHTQPIPYISNIVEINELPGGNYILTGWSEKRNRMVHVTDHEFSSIEHSFVNIEDVAPYFEGVTDKRWMQSAACFVEVKEKGQVIITPAYYDGSLYRYDRSNNSAYSLANKIDGYNNIDPPLTFHRRSDSPSRINGMINTPEDGYMMIKNYSTSFGIYKLKDGTFIHLSFLYSDKTTKLVIEHFSENMKLLNDLVTDELNLGMTNRKEPLWVDKNGQIYFTDNAEKPKIRRIQITGLGFD